MTGNCRLQRFKDITSHGYTIPRLLGIDYSMILLDHARRTTDMMDVTSAVGLNANPLRRPPVVLNVVLPAMVPGAVMLALITIASTGIRTYHVRHANAVFTLLQTAICLQWLYFWSGITDP